MQPISHLSLRSFKLLTAICFAAATSVAFAADVPVVADTYVLDVNGNGPSRSNYGTDADLKIGGGGQALIRFDMTGVPSHSPPQTWSCTPVK